MAQRAARVSADAHGGSMDRVGCVHVCRHARSGDGGAEAYAMSADYWQAAQWDEERWIEEANELAQEASDEDERTDGQD
jgi:hypothetical protein